MEVARHLGLDAPGLLAQLGLSSTIFDAPGQRIPVTAAVALLNESARVSGCETLGLRMAELRQLSDFGEVSLLLRHQRTLRDALQVIVQYSHLLSDALAIHVEETGNTVVIREEVVTDTHEYSRQATELAIGIMHRFCAAMLGAQWRPISANFTHSAPASLNIHRRIFGCRLEFDVEFNGIVCPAADLDAVNPQANEAMARIVRHYLDSLPTEGELSLVFKVRKTLFLLLPMGRATIEQVAQTQGMSVRTLQGRLEECGATFSDLLNSVRREMVFRYLENPSYALGRVAGMLGYSIPSSFTRWFIAQFGTPPAAWRAQHGIVLRKER
ncbi:AraC family transcriptional regulator [Pseudomonas schmalbachii]|uniref:AraC family transcriptional regulator n=1 Tax=Pseudomonas schmalbachii TaxID=2816993 RepID=A0ABS3TPD6_9PSED|nr:AraC family transcriptional regulator [Pseudomonas schmalbachii]MBO3275532.1 AraC family transcriptional regulator [Pseudomonas schmalbachii]